MPVPASFYQNFEISSYDQLTSHGFQQLMIATCNGFEVFSFSVVQSATFSFTYEEILAVPTTSLINNSGQLSTGAEPVLVGKRDFKKYDAVLYHRCLLFRSTPPLPLFFFVQRRMRFLILDRSVGLKKKNWNLKKKNHKIELSEEEALVPLDEVKS